LSFAGGRLKFANRWNDALPEHTPESCGVELAGAAIIAAQKLPDERAGHAPDGVL